MEKLVYSVIITIATFIITLVLNSIVEKIRSIKDKPRFFIHSLFYTGLYNGQREYQLKGRLVGNRNGYYDFKSVIFELPKDCKWIGGPSCECYTKQDNDNIFKPNSSTTTSIKADEQEKNKLKIDYSLNIGEDTTYDIVGYYSAPRDIASSSIKIYFIKDEQNKQTKENTLTSKKCPNIRQFWLRFYIVFSMVITFLGVASVWICVENWNCLKEACPVTWPDLQIVLGIFGLIFLIITIFFIGVFLRCLYAFHVIKIMNKFTIPKKDPNIAVSETLLVPRIFQFMTGTEDVDNIL